MCASLMSLLDHPGLFMALMHVVHMQMSRMQVIASTDPKPVPGDWSGNGAPVKFSTRETREEGKGWFVIQEHLRRLQHVSQSFPAPYFVCIAMSTARAA